MTTFYSPDGNPEIWDEKPASYITVEEWEAARAAEAAEAEAKKSGKKAPSDLPPGMPDPTEMQGAPLPQAVELMLERRDGVVFRQLFLVGSGARPAPRSVTPAEAPAGG